MAGYASGKLMNYLFVGAIGACTVLLIFYQERRNRQDVDDMMNKTSGALRCGDMHALPRCGA